MPSFKKTLNLGGNKFEVMVDPWTPGHGIPAPEAYITSEPGMLVYEDQLDKIITALTAARAYLRAQAAKGSAVKRTARRSR